MPRVTHQLPANEDVILWIIAHRAGITERELGESMYGPGPDRQPWVNQECRLLEAAGLIERDGGSPRRWRLSGEGRRAA